MTRTTNKPGPGEYRITILDRPLIRSPYRNNERPQDIEGLSELAAEVVKVKKREARLREWDAEREKQKTERVTI